MNIYSLIPLVAFFFNGFVWTFIFAQQKQTAVTRSFLLYAADLSIWILLVVISRQPIPGEWHNIILKITSIAWLSITFWFLNFTYVFINRKRDFSFYLFLVITVVSIIISVSTNSVIAGTQFEYWGVKEIPGPLFIPFVFVADFLQGLYALYLIYREMNKSNDVNIVRSYTLLLIGSFIILIIGIISNLIMPYMLHFNFVRIAESGTIIQSIFILIAVKKYRLFSTGIEVASHDLFAQVEEAVIIMDKNGFIVEMNKSAENLFDLTYSDNPRVHIHSILSMHNIFNNFSGTTKEFNINGNPRILSLSQTSISHSDVEFGKILIIRDISEAKQVEQDLIEAKEKAEEMNRLKSSFLANMSHELRTPMIGILGCAEILAGENTNPETKELADIILESGQRLMNTLNSILNLSRLEANKVEIYLEEINLVDSIKNIIVKYQKSAENKNISFNAEFQKEFVYAIIDKEMLEQSLKNILDNAVKFTHEGEVKISVSRKSINNRAYAIIKISDTGIGILPENHKKIFEPFRQVSEGMARESEGTGLGLTITKKYIEMMHGNINLESETGKGSTFKLQLPAPAYDKVKKSPDNLHNIEEGHFSYDGVRNRKPKLLLVKNDKSIRKTIDMFLEDIYKLDLTDDANSVMGMVMNTNYDMILMDINLKGKNGVELTREIRKLPYYKDIPIAAIKAYALEGNKEKFLDESFSHYLVKPFSKKELLDLVNLVFQTQQL